MKNKMKHDTLIVCAHEIKKKDMKKFKNLSLYERTFYLTNKLCKETNYIINMRQPFFK
jgi:hypothetical protein